MVNIVQVWGDWVTTYRRVKETDIMVTNKQVGELTEMAYRGISGGLFSIV